MTLSAGTPCHPLRHQHLAHSKLMTAPLAPPRNKLTHCGWVPAALDVLPHRHVCLLGALLDHLVGHAQGVGLQHARTQQHCSTAQQGWCGGNGGCEEKRGE